MIIQRLSRGLQRQDWFTVFVEIVIVVVGVYVGIFLGEWQDDLERQEKTSESLLALQDELKADLKRIDEVIEKQLERQTDRLQAIEWLLSESFDADEMSALFYRLSNDGDTYFPNTSSYGAIQSAGYLAAIPDNKLRLHLTRLYEREFVRQSSAANLLDVMLNDFTTGTRTQYWDYANKRFMPGVANANIVLINGIYALDELGSFYLEFIRNQVRVDMVQAIAMIDTFLAK